MNLTKSMILFYNLRVVHWWFCGSKCKCVMPITAEHWVVAGHIPGDQPEQGTESCDGDETAYFSVRWKTRNLD